MRADLAGAGREEAEGVIDVDAEVEGYDGGGGGFVAEVDGGVWLAGSWAGQLGRGAARDDGFE